MLHVLETLDVVVEACHEKEYGQVLPYQILVEVREIAHMGVAHDVVDGGPEMSR